MSSQARRRMATSGSSDVPGGAVVSGSGESQPPALAEPSVSLSTPYVCQADVRQLQ